MEIYVFALKREDLLKLPEDELKLFLVFGKFVNDISWLQKLFFMMAYNQDKSGEPPMFAALHSNVIVQILSSKLFEGHRILQDYYFSGVSKHISPQLSQSAREAVRRVNKYFSTGDTPVEICRNKIAFHYDADLAVAGFRLAHDVDMLIMLTDTYSNSASIISEAAMNFGLYELIKPGDPRGAGEMLLDDIVFLIKGFLEFANEYFPYVVSAINGGKPPGSSATLNLNARKLEDIVIPFLIDLSDAAKSA